MTHLPMQEMQKMWVWCLGQKDPLQHSFLENSIDRGGWRATVHETTKSWTQQITHTHICTHTQYFIVYIYDILFIPSFVNWPLGYFHILAIVNNTVMKLGMHTYLSDTDFIYFGYKFRSEIVGSYLKKKIKKQYYLQ